MGCDHDGQHFSHRSSVRFSFFSFSFVSFIGCISVLFTLWTCTCAQNAINQSLHLSGLPFSRAVLSRSLFFMRKAKNQMKPHSSWKFFNVWNWNGLSDIEIESHCDEYFQSTKFETEMESIWDIASKKEERRSLYLWLQNQNIYALMYFSLRVCSHRSHPNAESAINKFNHQLLNTLSKWTVCHSNALDSFAISVIFRYVLMCIF